MIKWYYALLITTSSEEPSSNGGGYGFVSTSADAAALWRKRKQEIEELALARTQPRTISRSR